MWCVGDDVRGYVFGFVILCRRDRLGGDYFGASMIPVYPITSSDLKQNGGVFAVEGGHAVRVILAQNATSNVDGGALTPVYIVSGSEVHAAGGQWKVAAGPPLKIATISAHRGVSGFVAMPVFVVGTIVSPILPPTSPTYTPSLDFSDARNSQYFSLLF